jgi:6-phosphogluconolactonase (cycloisomerase 2 family)
VTDAAQVSFSPNGRVLTVTEKATNRLVTYVVGADGRPGDPQVFASAGMTPFGFSFDPHGRLIVSEAFGGAPEASAVSSYAVSSDGVLSVISASVGTTETAACWIIVTPGGRFAYTTNTASGSISGYAVAPDGSLSLLDDDGVTGVTGMGSGPIDLALSRDGRFLYSLNSGNGTLSGFHVAADGRLLSIGTVAGIPGGANGLVAR